MGAYWRRWDCPYHTIGGGDVIMQIGSGIFGVRNEDGTFSWEKFKEKSAIPELRAFEIKLAQGAKIRVVMWKVPR
ncbi:MAG: hypothetical protein CM1200mP1_04290 [Candidatus Neomarinimicrobiota bacterium]|nr:MAG: hypothetical protein CM1200mP1_04290 [Candidatus Neomarinimicrobiota bacterium]